MIKLSWILCLDYAPLGIVWQLNTKTWPRETVTGRFLGCDNPEKQQTACSAQF